jgi:membrane-associated phospholipid phosphatase
MQNDTEAVPSPPGKTGPGFWRLMGARYTVRRRQHRPLPWLGYTFSVINIVAIAFFVLDAPLGKAAKDLPPALVAIAGDVTNVAQILRVLGAIIVIFVVGFLLARRMADLRRGYRLAHLRWMSAYLLVSVLSASAVVHVVKTVIGRARPLVFDQYGIFGFRPFNGSFLFQSFPSAHSTQVGAFCVALALLFPRFRLVLVGAALWIGATRVILGVHYPSDVAAGLGLGAWFAFATATMFSRFGLLFALSPNGFPVPRVRGLMRRRPLADG